MNYVRVSENVKMFVEHPFCGRFEIPIDKVEVIQPEPNRASKLEHTKIHFTKQLEHGKTQRVALDITWAMLLIAEHIKMNNYGKEERARAWDEKLDRYEVRDMCVEEILFDGGKASLYCTWLDCYGIRRMYYAHECDICTRDSKSDLFMQGHTPTFYF